MAVLNVPSPWPRRQGRPSQNRRRSSMADLTGRLLADDSLDGPTGLAMLAPPGSAGGVAPPSSPEDSPADRVRHAGKPSAHYECLTKRFQSYRSSSAVVPNPLDASESRRWNLVFQSYSTACAGKDMTTGLLLEDTSAPEATDDDSGQLGQLRKKLNLLQGTQARISSPITTNHERLHRHRLLCIGVHWLLAFQVC